METLGTVDFSNFVPVGGLKYGIAQCTVYGQITLKAPVLSLKLATVAVAAAYHVLCLRPYGNQNVIL